MNSLRRLLHMLGPLGILGLGVLVASAAFYWSAIKPAERDLAVQRMAAQNQKPSTPIQPVSVDRRGDELRRFQALFPTADKIPAEVDKLWALARAYKLELPTGEYRLETNTPGLVRYRVTLPVRGNYAQVRQLLDGLLKTMPTVSIDGLRFERKKVTDTQLDAQLRLTMYFRPAPVLTER